VHTGWRLTCTALRKAAGHLSGELFYAIKESATVNLANKIVMRPVASLVPYASNSRTHTPARLRALLSGVPLPLQFSDHQIGRGRAFYEQACSLKLEGIISKQADAPYAPGNRGLWLKVKCLNREEFVVVGWTA
jgi:hypothetical protein